MFSPDMVAHSAKAGKAAQAAKASKLALAGAKGSEKLVAKSGAVAAKAVTGGQQGVVAS